MIVDPIQVKKVIRQIAKEEILPHFQNLQSAKFMKKDGEKSRALILILKADYAELIFYTGF